MYFKSSLFILVLIVIIFAGCNPNDQSYSDEDLIYKYVSDNDSLFYEANYYLLFFKSPRMSCVDKSINYQADPLIRNCLDTVGNIRLFVITNNRMLKKWSSLFYHGKDSPIIHLETHKTLDAYGIPYTPLIFRFEKGEISHWRFIHNNYVRKKNEVIDSQDPEGMLPVPG
ncbi:MAG: hypothetical protein K9H84_07730 [Bacteroidales bacterium]|nr:hypothetical protein [Bacteroidales bacterium]